MIDLDKQFLPPQTLLYDKATKHYSVIAGYDVRHETYAVVSAINHPITSKGHFPFVALRREDVHRYLSERRGVILNVYQHVEGMLEFNALTDIVYDDIATHGGLGTLLHGWRFRGKDGTGSCIWADVGAQMALMIHDRKTWMPFYKHTQVHAIPFREVLTGMIPSPPGWKHARGPQPIARRTASPEPSSPVHGPGDSSGQPVSDANRAGP